MKSSNLIKEFRETEEKLNQLTSVASRQEKLELAVVDTPFLLVSPDQMVLRIDENIIIFGILIMNAGKGVLTLNQIEAGVLARSHKVLYIEKEIKNDSQFHPLIVQIEIAGALETGTSLIRMHNSSMNAPDHLIAYGGTHRKFLKLGDDHFFVPFIVNSAPDHEPVSIQQTLPNQWQEIKLNDDLNCEHSLKLWGKNSLGAPFKKMGEIHENSISDDWFVSLDKTPLYYFVENNCSKFTAGRYASGVRYEKSHCFAELQPQKAPVQLSLFNCSPTDYQIRLESDPTERLKEVSPQSFLLKANAVEKITIQPSPESLQKGENIINLNLLQEPNQELLGSVKLVVRILNTQPAMFFEPPEPENDRVKVERHLYGIDYSLPLRFVSYGIGKHLITVKNNLTGQVNLLPVNSASDRREKHELEVLIETKLIPPFIGKISLTINTGCYLENERRHDLTLIFQRWSRIKYSPRFIIFKPDIIRQGKYLPVGFWRPDGEDIDITVDAEGETADLLSIKPFKKNVWLVGVTSKASQKTLQGLVVEIRFIDNISKMIEFIPVGFA